VHVQGQASDILIQAKEIERLRDLLVSLYVKHCGQETETVGEQK
jgi:ATP-dependent protease ClpP protease subunit